MILSRVFSNIHLHAKYNVEKREETLMWECEKCEREFKNTNQDHYCVKIDTIDQYIYEQTKNTQLILQ